MSAPPAAPAPSQLRGSYLVQNPRLWYGLRCADALLGLLPRAKAASGEPPRRVLISNWGHLGDVVIASSVLPLVRAAWPEAEIGFLAGSWSRVVLDGHPLIDRVHVVDHWKLNRSATGRAARFRRYRETRATALREIRAVGYDLAIDLYAYFPNAIPLLWRAGIPRRVGHGTGGFGALLTDDVPWQEGERHMAEHHLDLLEAAGVQWKERPEPRYSLAPGKWSGERRLVEVGLPEEYLVLHMGAGSAMKEWPQQSWREVVRRLTEAGHAVVFTGAGAEQRRAAESVGEGSGCLNLCDTLGWNDFVEVVRGARLLVSVDSVAGHVAAAVGTPSVVLATGITNLHQWRPLHERSLPIRHFTPCAPCYRSTGCDSMACIRETSPHEVVRTITRQLEVGSFA